MRALLVVYTLLDREGDVFHRFCCLPSGSDRPSTELAQSQDYGIHLQPATEDFPPFFLLFFLVSRVLSALIQSQNLEK